MKHFLCRTNDASLRSCYIVEVHIRYPLATCDTVETLIMRVGVWPCVMYCTVKLHLRRPLHLIPVVSTTNQRVVSQQQSLKAAHGSRMRMQSRRATGGCRARAEQKQSSRTLTSGDVLESRADKVLHETDTVRVQRRSERVGSYY